MAALHVSGQCSSEPELPGMMFRGQGCAQYLLAPSSLMLNEQSEEEDKYRTLYGK